MSKDDDSERLLCQGPDLAVESHGGQRRGLPLSHLCLWSGVFHAQRDCLRTMKMMLKGECCRHTCESGDDEARHLA